MAPFNSQNTFLTREAVKEYFMFPHVGRMDDIWGSLYLVSKGFEVVYSKATVFQSRNVHDLTKDFSGEIIGYENTYKLGAALRDNPDAIRSFLPEKSWEAFVEYKKIAADLD
jgi:subtilase family serine protease